MTDRKDLIVMRGPSTSGKDTAAAAMLGYHLLMDALKDRGSIDDVPALLEFVQYSMEQQAFAADKFPGLYTYDNGPDEKPTYHLPKQASAHTWCRATLEGAMEAGTTPLAVCNTNMKLTYIEPYQALAKQYGYNVHIIHCEGITRADGLPVENPHGTPPGIIESQIQGFQLLHPPAPGITVQETAQGIMAITETHDIVIADLVGTLIKTAPGKRWINQVDDFVLMENVIAKLIKLGFDRVSVASNQCGIGNGNMSPDTYLAIIKRFVKEATQAGLTVDQVVTATHRAQKNALIWLPSRPDQIKPTTLTTRADKPGYGMLTHLADKVGINSALFIGDAHVTGRAEDIGAARIFKEKTARNLTYLPVDALIPHG